MYCWMQIKCSICCGTVLNVDDVTVFRHIAVPVSIKLIAFVSNSLTYCAFLGVTMCGAVQEEKAQSILRTVTNKRLVGNLQSLKAQGQLTLEKARFPLLVCSVLETVAHASPRTWGIRL